jgi:hypothetical protein
MQIGWVVRQAGTDRPILRACPASALLCLCFFVNLMHATPWAECTCKPSCSRDKKTWRRNKFSDVRAPR